MPPVDAQRYEAMLDLVADLVIAELEREAAHAAAAPLHPQQPAPT